MPLTLGDHKPSTPQCQSHLPVAAAAAPPDAIALLLSTLRSCSCLTRLVALRLPGRPLQLLPLFGDRDARCVAEKDDPRAAEAFTALRGTARRHSVTSDSGKARWGAHEQSKEGVALAVKLTMREGAATRAAA